MSARKAVAATLIVVGGLALYDFGYTMVWDGSFSLTVNLRPAEPDRITRVWAGATYRRDYVSEFLDTPQWAERLTAIADWQKPFVVEVTCSGAESGFGRERWHAQYRTLVIRVEYLDGHREDKVVNIPDHKQTRELAVELP